MRGFREVLLAAGLIVACSSGGANDAAREPEVVSSQKARLMAPDVPPEDAEALRAGNTAFAVDLYRQSLTDPALAAGNVAFSPHSISLALAMTYAGANGNTAKQMASVLHFTLPSARLHPAFDQLDLALTSRGATDPAKSFRLTIASSMWGAPGMAWNAAFLDTLAIDYGAGVRVTDFGNAEGARRSINAWVDAHTEDRIKELLPSDSIHADTKLVLADAIYFHAGWLVPFLHSQTMPGVFHAPSHDVSAAMMHQEGGFPHATGAHHKVVELPYEGNALSFVAVLPDDLAAFERDFTGDTVKEIVGSLTPATTRVSIALPKLDIEGKPIRLRSALMALGMTDAFGPADFSGMTAAGLHVDDVVHQADVTVDEDGTTAAAATAVTFVDGGVSQGNDVITFDRPFVFFVRDIATGAILFLGRVVDPS